MKGNVKKGALEKPVRENMCGDAMENIRANLERHKIEAQFYEVGLPYIFNFFEQRRLRNKLKSLAASMQRGSFALDLGSGTGNVAKYIRSFGLDVVAADLSKEMLRLNPVSSRVICDAHHLPLKEGKFAMVTTYSFFHHCHSPEVVLSEIIRVAAPKCTLYFGWDHFLPAKGIGSPIRWLATHPKGTFGWILWLLSRPSRLGILFTYLFFRRRRHLRRLSHDKAAESHDVFLARRPSQFIQRLKRAGFCIMKLTERELIARRESMILKR